MPNLSGIDSASGEDSSGMGSASGEGESGEDESGIESGSGAGIFCLFFTNLIWLFSMSFPWGEFSSNQETQKALEESNFLLLKCYHRYPL